MDIGVGTYALFWEWNERNPAPLPIEGMLERAATLGCEVFQICDDPRIDAYDDAALSDLRQQAHDLGLRLELGTRGIAPEHLERYLDIATRLDAPVLRSMIQRPEMADGVEGAVRTLRRTVARLESDGVDLALETYEQVSTSDLLDVVERLQSPRVGICLDPANCVSALEHPDTVVDDAATHALSLHVKDFRFDRQDGWVGFTLSGARIGEGLLDLQRELDAVYTGGRAPAAIVEHWLPWQGDLELTLAIEREWTQATLRALRHYRDNHPQTTGTSASSHQGEAP
ncbi:MAG: TIM barrel protein [Ornithinimicrobium sp.]